MNGYLISTGDRPGLAAKLFEAAAARGVNGAWNNVNLRVVVLAEFAVGVGAGGIEIP